MGTNQSHKNPFQNDTPATATHLSTWNEKSTGNTFYWSKEKYKILTEYYEKPNEIHVKIFYNNELIKENKEIMYTQTPSIEDICRTTQRILTKHLEEW